MNNQGARRALGRGLLNLIPTQSEERGSGNEIVFVDINAIRPNPFQPRVEFNDEEIQGLAQSIKVQGLLQPIVLRQKIDFFEIISGERRYRAFKFLGRDKMPCIIKPKVTDREMVELALVENIQRENLNEIEKAVAYQQLLLEHNYTHEQLSVQVGKSRTAITNTLRLLNLPDDIQQMLRKELISMGHARALLSVENVEDQMALAKKILEKKLSVRDIEKETQTKKEISPKKIKVSYLAGATQTDPDMDHQIERLRYKFGTPVKIHQLVKGKGSIVIDYFDQDDLVRIFDLLLPL